jgi:DNA replication protein DnaC
MTIPIAVYILLAIVITGFVFMFIYANKKDFDQSIKRSLAEEALEDYLVRIKNAYDLSVLDEIYNSIFKDTSLSVVLLFLITSNTTV